MKPTSDVSRNAIKKSHYFLINFLDTPIKCRPACTSFCSFLPECQPCMIISTGPHRFLLVVQHQTQVEFWSGRSQRHALLRTDCCHIGTMLSTFRSNYSNERRAFSRHAIDSNAQREQCQQSYENCPASSCEAFFRINSMWLSALLFGTLVLVHERRFQTTCYILRAVL